MRVCWAGVAPVAEGTDVEEAALGHGASSAVEVVTERMTSLVLDGPAFFISMPLVTGKMAEGADDTCLGGMGAGGTAYDRRENAEVLGRL